MKISAKCILFLQLLLTTTPLAADTPKVEIKVSVKPSEISDALRAFGLRPAAARKRLIYFFDTPKLTLFHKGTILRGRRKERTEEDDSTVKIRPLRRGDVDPAWFELAGFKCEADRNGDKSVPSCSLSVEQKAGEIGEVARGNRKIKRLFSKDQEEFLETHSRWSGDWDELRPLGPVHARNWKMAPEDLSEELPDDLSIELWELSPTLRMLEVSIRVPFNIVDATEKKIDRVLRARGIDASEKRETKTRFALEHFASRLRP